MFLKERVATVPDGAGSYRWVILLLLGLNCFIGNASQFQLSAMAYQIIPKYQLSMAQFSSILNAPMLCAVFLGIPGGALADRFGVKRVVAAGAIISTIAMYFRAYADSYWKLLICMFFLGVSLSLISSNVSKMLGVWFAPKQLGIAIGCYFFFAMTGNTTGLAVTPFFATMHSAFLTFATIMLILGVLWILLAKDKPKNIEAPPVMPVSKYIGVAAKSKNVWLAGIAALFYMGGIVTFMGFLPTALHTLKGIDPSTASIMASVLTFGNMLGSIGGPMICDRLGKIKPALALMGFIGAIFLYFSWIIPAGAGKWIMLAAAGVITGGILPILLSLPMRLPEIGQVYAGSAGGIISTVNVMGAFFLPTFVIGTIAGNNYNLMFFLGSIAVLLVVPVVLLLPEVGLKSKVKADIGRKSTLKV